MKRSKYLALFAIFCLLIVIPTAFAFDNETAISAGEGEVQVLTLDVDAETPVGDNQTADDDTLGEEYYFDANADYEYGNGTEESPFREFSYIYVDDNVIIHLANGEYDLDRSISANNVTIIGQDPANTIVRFDGVGFKIGKSFTIQNVTLESLGISLSENTHADFSNTIFQESHADNGGAINAKSNCEVNLDNCSFIDNSATFGGAIYASGGVLNIYNCLFVNNRASEYGGAIVSRDGNELSIRKSKFFNSTTGNDAGGAIYIFKSRLNATDLEMTGSRSTFGGAVTSLASDLNISGMMSKDNRAEYNGGVIYHMYGNAYISNSTFINNTAKNGAALFLTNLDNCSMANLAFENNTASNAAAVYVIMDSVTVSNLTFMNNHAFVEKDYFQTTMPDLNIGNGNYTIIKYNASYNGTFPSKYDLRELNQVTPIKNQGNGGNCWAYAMLGALESCIMKASGMEFDFSEENMKNLMALYSDYGWKMETNDGGYIDMGIGYFTSWLGPINETTDTYHPQSLLSAVYDSLFHIQNIVFLNRSSYTDNNAIKRAIMDYGAVLTSIYWSSSYLKGYNYYFNGNSGSNHAVTIVGWDDNYSKYNFKKTPEGDGAWIIRNSWGSTSGDKGYYYVSYYDVRCAPLNSPDSLFTFILNDTIKFDKNYQYDIPGCTDYFLNTTSTVWYKNRFNATDNEYLVAASTYFEKITDWELSVYVNGVLMLNQSGTSCPGYYTIDLNEHIGLKIGDIFEVAFKITVDGDVGFPISEAVSLNHEMYGENISFTSSDGVNWVDLYNLTWKYPSHTYASQVACIKAFTILNQVATNISIECTSYNPSTITAQVFNSFGRIVETGEVIFNVEGQNFTVAIVNGKAVLNHTFSSLGYKQITASFSNRLYLPSNATIIANVYMEKVDVALGVIKDVLDAVITVEVSKAISDTVFICLNGSEVYGVTVVDGYGNLSLTDLYYGNYSVVAFANSSSYYFCNVSASFTIDYMKTFIQAEDMVAYYNSTLMYYVKLVDRYGNPISGQSITFDINASTFEATSDADGMATIAFSLLPETYVVNISFASKGIYLKSNASRSIVVNPLATSIFLNCTYYNPATISVYVIDQYGQTVESGNVTFYVEGKTIQVPIENSLASLSYKFSSFGYKQIEASFSNPGYVDSNASITEYVHVGKVNVSLNVIKDVLDAVINVGLSENISDAIFISINGCETYNVPITNGIGSLSLNDLYYGNYSVLAFGNSPDYYFDNVSTSFTIDYMKTFIQAEDMEAYYNSTLSYSAKLVDRYGNPISDQSVDFDFNGNIFTAKTDLNGNAIVYANLLPDTYHVNVNFAPQGRYLKSSVSKIFIVNPIAVNVSMNCTYYNPAVIDAFVVDQYGTAVESGNVTFYIEGKAIEVAIENGRATLEYEFSSIGLKQISAVYECTGYSSFNATITADILMDKVNIGLDIVKDVLDVSININMSKAVSDTVYICINGYETYKVQVVDGAGNLSLDDLYYGNYSVLAFSNSSEYYCENVTDSFTIDYMKTFIMTDDLEVCYNSTLRYSAKLVDKYGNPISGQYITFEINGNEFEAKTDLNGTATVTVSLSPKSYGINITFSSKGKYLASSGTGKLTVKETLILIANSKFTYNAYFTADLLDEFGNPLANTQVSVVIGSNTYKATTNGNGKLSLRLQLNAGKYTVKVTNPKTKQVKSKAINVVSRITLNRDITMYYGAGTLYKVRVFDDYGNVAKGVKVTFTVNGKTYTRTSDASGYASFKIALNPNTYKITASYSGFKVTNKIVVKPTIVTKNIAVKKGKQISFSAKLLNSKGQILKSKIVTFTFKAKTYKVKTDAKGFAVLKITNNYNVGKYTITSKYSTLTVKNTVTIKN